MKIRHLLTCDFTLRLESCMRSRFTMAAILVAVGASSAQAQVFSTLTESGSTRALPSQTQLLRNMRDLIPDQDIVQIAFGDEAITLFSLHGSTGLARMKVHACSGPPLVDSLGGTASASGSVYYEENFTIQSLTLPVGTPVTIHARVTVARSFLAMLDNRNPAAPPNALATSSGSAGIRIDTLAIGAATFSGDFFGQETGSIPRSHTATGLFGTSFGDPYGPRVIEANEFNVQVNGIVGGRFNFALQTSFVAGSMAQNPYVAGGDAEVAFVWGAAVLGGLAEIRSPLDNFLFPPLAGAGPERALSYLPDAPVPEPASALLMLLGGVAVLRLARQRAAGRQPH